MVLLVPLWQPRQDRIARRRDPEPRQLRQQPGHRRLPIGRQPADVLLLSDLEPREGRGPRGEPDLERRGVVGPSVDAGQLRRDREGATAEPYKAGQLLDGPWAPRHEERNVGRRGRRRVPRRIYRRGAQHPRGSGAEVGGHVARRGRLRRHRGGLQGVARVLHRRHLALRGAVQRRPHGPRLQRLAHSSPRGKGQRRPRLAHAPRLGRGARGADVASERRTAERRRPLRGAHEAAQLRVPRRRHNVGGEHLHRRVCRRRHAPRHVAPWRLERPLARAAHRQAQRQRQPQAARRRGLQVGREAVRREVGLGKDYTPPSGRRQGEVNEDVQILRRRGALFEAGAGWQAHRGRPQHRSLPRRGAGR
mmetsp:Transcript_116899/g.337839  ORF Transcript_116899/g.337839 Transcript_116899/m.337839 type:complete len:363 (-) Transcript_116899:391-1479(-)